MALIGDHPLLDRLAELLAKDGPAIRSADGGAPDVADDADAIVVAFASDDARTIAVARTFAADGPVQPILLSAALAGRKRRLRLPDLDGFRIVDPLAAALRGLHELYPPFADAFTLGQSRIHCLILGGGGAWEHVLTDVLLSSLADGLDVPLFTIVDPDAAELAASIARRCPELGRSADIAFLAPPRSLEMIGTIEMLRAAAKVTSITTAYAFDSAEAAAIDLARMLTDVAGRDGWAVRRIFVEGLAEQDPRPVDPSDRMQPLGGIEDLAAGLGLLSATPDLVARGLHAAYRAAAPEAAVANKPWEELGEDQREANRRVLAHIPAKLASAGVPLGSWLDARRTGRTVPFPQLPDLAAAPDLRLRLARLEHDRWMAERRLSGWRYGAERDDDRRLHPDLIAFDALSERSRDYDRVIVDALAAALASGIDAA